VAALAVVLTQVMVGGHAPILKIVAADAFSFTVIDGFVMAALTFGGSGVIELNCAPVIVEVAA